MIGFLIGVGAGFVLVIVGVIAASVYVWWKLDYMIVRSEGSVPGNVEGDDEYGGDWLGS